MSCLGPQATAFACRLRKGTVVGGDSTPSIGDVRHLLNTSQVLMNVRSCQPVAYDQGEIDKFVSTAGSITKSRMGAKALKISEVPIWPSLLPSDRLAPFVGAFSFPQRAARKHCCSTGQLLEQATVPLSGLRLVMKLSTRQACVLCGCVAKPLGWRQCL